MTVKNDTPSHVAWTGDNLIVVEEAAAWKIAVMSRQLPAHTHVALACLQTVDWTYVVKATACHKVAGRCICTRHYPARSQWNCMYLQNSTKQLQAIRITYGALPILAHSHDCLLNGIPHSESKVPCWSVIGWFTAGKSLGQNVANWLHNINIARVLV